MGHCVLTSVIIDATVTAEEELGLQKMAAVVAEDHNKYMRMVIG